MTRSDHPTGTDRLAEVAGRIDTDLVVNVQGDEPLIDPRMIEEAVAPLLADPATVMGTLMTRIDDAADLANPNVVKVVADSQGFALYFSRAAIPYPRDLDAAAAIAAGELNVFRHIGLYVYRRDFLLRFSQLPATPLEQLEKLEQLRALESGYRIRVATTELVSYGVDTPEDLAKVQALALRVSGK